MPTYEQDSCKRAVWYVLHKKIILWFLGNTLHFGLLHLVSGEAKRQTFYNALTSRLGKLDGETKK